MSTQVVPPPSKPRAPQRTRSRRPLVGLGAIVVVAGALAIVAVTISGGSSTGSVSVVGGSGSAAKNGAPVSASKGGVQANGTSGGKTSSGRSGGATFFGAGASGSGTGTSGRSGSGAAAATQALNTYLQGLSHLSVEQVSLSSDSGPFAMAGMLLDAAVVNSERGATTTIVLGPSSLAPGSVGATSLTVVFQGSVTLTTTISGPKGSGTFTDTISGPLTVTNEAGVWRVTNFTYDNQPVQVWPESASQTVNGLNISLGYLVSYGNTTAALITLRQASGSANVQLQAVTLRSGSAAENGAGDFTGPPTPSGVLLFARIPSAPTSLTLLFTSSTGQTDYFNFTLS